MVWVAAIVVWCFGSLLLLAWLAGDVAESLVDRTPAAPVGRIDRAIAADRIFSHVRYRPPSRLELEPSIEPHRGLAALLGSGLDDLRELARDRRTRVERLAMYVAGCLLWSLGLKLFIDADLGVDPLHSMVLGLVETIDLPFIQVGAVTTAVTLAFLLLWSAWNRKAPPLSTLVTMASVGFLVDLWNLLDAQLLTETLLAPVPRMLTGLLLEAYASALIIMSGIGIRVMDLVAITAARRWHAPFVAPKMGLEIGFFAAAAVLGGPIGLATVGFLAIVAPFIPSFMWANARLLRLPNHGLLPA